MTTDTNTPLTSALDVAVISLRLAIDDGRRAELDEVIESFGWSRGELDPAASAGADAVLETDM